MILIVKYFIYKVLKQPKQPRLCPIWCQWWFSSPTERFFVYNYSAHSLCKYYEPREEIFKVFCLQLFCTKFVRILWNVQYGADDAFSSPMERSLSWHLFCTWVMQILRTQLKYSTIFPFLYFTFILHMGNSANTKNTETKIQQQNYCNLCKSGLQTRFAKVWWKGFFSHFS